MTEPVEHTQDPTNPISNETGEYVGDNARTVDRRGERLSGVEINIRDANEAIAKERELQEKYDTNRPHSFNGRLVGEERESHEIRDERTPDEDGPTDIARRNAENNPVDTDAVKELNPPVQQKTNTNPSKLSKKS